MRMFRAFYVVAGLFVCSASIAEPLQGTIVITRSGEDSVPLLWEGVSVETSSSWGGNIRRIQSDVVTDGVQNGLRTELAKTAGDVKVAVPRTRPDQVEDAALVTWSLVRVDSTCGGFLATACNLDLTIAVMIGDEEDRWTREFTVKQNFSNGGWPGNLLSALQIAAPLVGGNAGMVMASDPNVQQLVGLGGAAAAVEGVLPMDATYRISDIGGKVRKKPDGQAKPIKKYGLGSVIRVTGKLESGWFQVSVGERPIGWVAANSVVRVIPPAEWPSQAGSYRKQSKAAKPAQLEEARKLFSMAFKLFQGGDFAASKLAFERGFALDPGNGMARFYAAETLARMKDNAGAYEQYGFARELLPANSGESLKAEAALNRLGGG